METPIYVATIAAGALAAMQVERHGMRRTVWLADCSQGRMLMPRETEMFESARELAIASRTPIDGESAQEVKQRAEAEFLRRLILAMQPMLHESMRSHRIQLASDTSGVVMLKSDGTFIHVDIADQEDVLLPLQVLQAAPSLLSVLSRIEEDLLAGRDAGASSAADVVRLARHALAVAEVDAARFAARGSRSRDAKPR